MTSHSKQFVLTQVVYDFSKLPTHYRGGTKRQYANVGWQIGVAKRDQYFRVRLFCLQPKGDHPWSISTNFIIRVLSVDGQHLTNAVEYTFAGESTYSFCYYDFPSDTIAKNFVVEDKLIIEITVAIGSITGIKKPDVLRDFNVPSAFTDVALKVGEKKFFVSKVYLATQSESFQSLLFGGFKEASQAEVELKEVDPEAFQIFLELIHIENTLTDSNIEDVLILVDKFLAKNIAHLCEEFLINKSQHCIRTKLRIAAQYNFKELKARFPYS
ncbi:hypothetical protein CAEBREN_16142 [Caenorhabditis brenneri]|uniref:BTB domain-containing protein n=1 Tax=Caenorhabditis brenneri TaxID=135651 RepID=G0MDB8_CAEBE|nr:hypothetical protein CAEBREN_16142 [Caenorhabditis brenneri]